jgi:hypothetical protein
VNESSARVDDPRYEYLSDARADLDPAAGEAFLRAVHLAGHAVASQVCGADFGPLRLDRPLSERCRFSPPVSPAPRGPARNATEAAINTLLAGSAAETIAGAPASPCADVASLLTDGDPAEAEPYIDWLRMRAAGTLSHPLRQRIVLALARALIEHTALDAHVVRAIADGEIARYMRGQWD